MRAARKRRCRKCCPPRRFPQRLAKPHITRQPSRRLAPRAAARRLRRAPRHARSWAAAGCGRAATPVARRPGAATPRPRPVHGTRPPTPARAPTAAARGRPRRMSAAAAAASARVGTEKVPRLVEIGLPRRGLQYSALSRRSRGAPRWRGARAAAGAGLLQPSICHCHRPVAASEQASREVSRRWRCTRWRIVKTQLA